MTTKRWIAVTFLLGLLVAMPACSSRQSSSTGNVRTVVVSGVQTKPFEPPRTPQTAAGAEEFVRAYVAALISLDSGIDPAVPGIDSVDMRLSATEYRLIDAHGKVVASEPASAATLHMELAYQDGTWHIGTLVPSS